MTFKNGTSNTIMPFDNFYKRFRTSCLSNRVFELQSSLGSRQRGVQSYEPMILHSNPIHGSNRDIVVV